MSKFWANLNVNDLMSNLSLDNLQKVESASSNTKIEGNLPKRETQVEDQVPEIATSNNFVHTDSCKYKF